MLLFFFFLCVLTFFPLAVPKDHEQPEHNGNDEDEREKENGTQRSSNASFPCIVGGLRSTVDRLFIGRRGGRTFDGHRLFIGADVFACEQIADREAHGVGTGLCIDVRFIRLEALGTVAERPCVEHRGRRQRSAIGYGRNADLEPTRVLETHVDAAEQEALVAGCRLRDHVDRLAHERGTALEGGHEDRLAAERLCKPHRERLRIGLEECTLVLNVVSGIPVVIGVGRGIEVDVNGFPAAVDRLELEETGLFSEHDMALGRGGREGVEDMVHGTAAFCTDNGAGLARMDGDGEAAFDALLLIDGENFRIQVVEPRLDEPVTERYGTSRFEEGAVLREDPGILRLCNRVDRQHLEDIPDLDLDRFWRVDVWGRGNLRKQWSARKQGECREQWEGG
jgi:hypothetical protein